MDATASSAKGPDLRTDPVEEMLSEGGGVVGPPPEEMRARSDLEAPATRWSRWLEDKSRKWGTAKLKELVKKQGQVSHTLGGIPENMHRVANQTRLILELIDDFKSGAYRKISWRSFALLVGAVLYAVSPADVIPDGLPLIGQFDDLAILAVVTRLLNKDLRDYCQFKGYPEKDYFRA